MCVCVRESIVREKERDLVMYKSENARFAGGLYIYARGGKEAASRMESAIFSFSRPKRSPPRLSTHSPKLIQRYYTYSRSNACAHTLCPQYTSVPKFVATDFIQPIFQPTSLVCITLIDIVYSYVYQINL